VTLNILQTAKDMAIVATMLSNGAISNDIERLQMQISRSRHYLILNVSEMVRDTDS